MWMFNCLVDMEVEEKAANRRRVAVHKTPETEIVTPQKNQDAAAAHDDIGSPHAAEATTKSMEQIDYLMWNITRTGALSVGELIGAMSKVRNKNKWMHVYTAPYFGTLVRKAFELTRAIAAEKPWIELLKEFEPLSEDHRFYNIPTSMRIFEQWIKHHNIDRDKFLADTFAVLTQKKPKINCIVLEGVSNAGKSYIMRGLKYISHSYGEIHAGDTNAFQFSNCINTNIIYIDEPRISPEIAEQMKLVMEGCPTKVKVKNRDDEILKRTPIVMTTNSPVWKWCGTERQAMKNRMFHYKLIKAADWLKYCTKSLNPGIWKDLFHGMMTKEENDEDVLEMLEALEGGQRFNPPVKRKLVMEPECEGCEKDLPSQNDHECVNEGVDEPDIVMDSEEDTELCEVVVQVEDTVKESDYQKMDRLQEQEDGGFINKGDKKELETLKDFYDVKGRWDRSVFEQVSSTPNQPPPPPAKGAPVKKAVRPKSLFGEVSLQPPVSQKRGLPASVKSSISGPKGKIVKL